MEFAYTIKTATDLLYECTTMDKSKLLMKTLEQDPSKETIDYVKSMENLKETINSNGGCKYFEETRVAAIKLLNFILMSGMAQGAPKDVCNSCLLSWWWENAYRLKKILYISAFLEGRNLESFGVKEFHYGCIPQAIPAVRYFIKELEKYPENVKYVKEGHHILCSQSEDVVQMYCFNIPLKE